MVERWSLAPYLNFRLAGIAYDGLAALGFERTTAHIARIAELEEWLAAQREELSTVLFAAIPQASDAATRNALLKLKRAIAGDNPFTDTTGILHTTGLFDAAILDRLTEWQLRVERYRAALATGDALLDDELRQKRHLLRDLLRDPDYTKGILASSAELYAGLQRYIATERISKNERRAEHALLMYLSRMTVKPSPYATFTTTNLGQYQPDVAETLRWTVESMEKRSYIRFNVNAALIMADAISRAAHIRPHLVPRHNPSIRVEGDSLRYYRSMTQHRVFVMRAGMLRTIKNTAHIRLALDILRDMPGARLTEWVAAIARQDPAIGHNAATFADRLIEVGLVNIVPPLSSSDTADILPDLLAALPDSVETAPLREIIAELAADVVRYAAADAEGRRRVQADAQARIATFHRVLGVEPAFAYPHMGFFLEDSSSGLRDVTLGEGFVASAGAGLQAIQRMRINSSPVAALSAMLTDAFVADYGIGGQCEDLLGFFDRYSKTMERRLTTLADPLNIDLLVQQSQRPQVVAAHRAHHAYLAYFRQKWAGQQADEPAARVMTVDPAEIAEIEHSAAITGQPHASVAAFVQIAARDRAALERGDYLVVLNRVTGGNGQLFSRYAYMQDGTDRASWLSAAIAAQLRAATPDRIPLEIVGSFGASNIQLHPSLTDYELVWPDETPRRPPAFQLTLDDLSLYHDPATDTLRLHVRRLGVDANPLYLGFLMPMMFAPPFTALTLLTEGVTPGFRTFWDSIERAYASGSTTPTTPIRHYPRTIVGNVVMERERWDIEQTQVPRPAAGETDFSFYCRLRDWQQSLGLPDQVFVRINHATMQRNIEDHKPIMIDFRNYLLAHSFMRLIEPDDYGLTVTEMLPAPDDLFFQHDGQRYVSELQLECYDMRHVTPPKPAWEDAPVSIRVAVPNESAASSSTAIAVEWFASPTDSTAPIVGQTILNERRGS